MTPDVSSSRELQTWAKSLKERLGETDGNGSSGKTGGSLPRGLQDELFEALDLLLTQATSPPTDERSGPIVDAIDASLAHWQASITVAYSEATAKELETHLRLAEQLSARQQEREKQLADHQQELENKLAALLQLEARLVRQRQGVAKELRARKSSMLLDVERRRQEVHDEIYQQLRKQVLNAAHAETESLQQRFDEQQTAREELQKQLDRALGEVELKQSELDRLQESDQQTASEHGETIRRLEEELARAHAKAATQTRESENSTDMEGTVAELKAELQDSRRELEQARQRAAELERQEADDSPSEKERRLEQMLVEAGQELEDLRNQNSDLAAQVAKHQVATSSDAPGTSFDQESLSWEERKKLIMQQLESEGSGDEQPSAERGAQRVEIDRVLSTTQAEIERRDQQIAELQTIIEQQSDTRGEVAIGAAAIAQMFDSDDLIQQEREKLKSIQQEWEEKLRKAEIDLSMERAKLARERTELEEQLAANTRDQPPANEAGDAKGQGRTRKWLEHLGLKDDSKN